MRRSGAPVTIGLIVAAVVMFLIGWSTAGAVGSTLAFRTDSFGRQPWTLFTYPFTPISLVQGPVFFLLFLLWLWWVGSSLERELGSKQYALFFLAMTVLPALILWLGAALLRRNEVASGFLLPLSALTVAWATRMPNAEVRLFMIIPVAAKWIGWLAVAGVVFNYGFGNPVIGVIAALHLAAAWAYAANRVTFLPYGRGFAGSRKPSGWKPRERDDRYFEDVRRREQEREERERLRKLFEGSIQDDPGDRR